MKFAICNAKGHMLEEIDLDVLSIYALKEVYNIPDNVDKTVSFRAFDTENNAGRYYSAIFNFHLQANLLLVFSYNSFDENKVTVSYTFFNPNNICAVTPLTIEEVKDVIRMSNKEES